MEGKGARTVSPVFWIGCVTLADLAAGRMLFWADETRVFFAGRALDWKCGFHAATGLPCPTCGLTRSVVMSLHGEFARAWHLAPGGPAVVIGLAVFALAMLALTLAQWLGAERRIAPARAWIRNGALAYAAAAAVVWLGGWVISFQAALALR